MSDIHLDKIIIKKLGLIFLLLFFCLNNYAENLGHFGQVYPIIEEDFLIFIKKRITMMQTNGEWHVLENQLKSNVEKHAIRPTPIISITHAKVTKSWFYDPSITIPYDLKDIEGHIIVKAGTAINPLRMITLHKVLVFFDGDDIKQQAWVKEIDRKFLGKIKLILVNGSIALNENYFLKPVYFDQEARLVTKFNIRHVPALIQQDEYHLKISEVAL